MEIIAELKMPFEKQDEVAQILWEGANSGTTEKLFFSRAFTGKYSLIRSSKEKILTYKSFKRKYSLIRASQENTHL